MNQSTQADATDVPRLDVVVRAQAKKWWKSKTLRFNLFVVVLAAAESQLHLIQPLLPVNFYQVLAFVVPIANKALRFLTTEGVKL